MDTATLETTAEAAAPATALAPGQYVIVRASQSGVHAGIYQGHSGQEVTLTQSRRLWRWFAAQGVSLNGVASHGIVASKSKIDPPVERVTLLEACEIILVTAEAAATIQDAPNAER